MGLFKDAEKKFTFEIVMEVRDKEGKPTGQRKSFASDKPHKICEFFERNTVKKKKKIKEVGKEGKNLLPTKSDADQIQSSFYGADYKSKAEKLEDEGKLNETQQ